MKKLISLLVVTFLLIIILPTAIPAYAEVETTALDINALEKVIKTEHNFVQEINGGNRVSFLSGAYDPKTQLGQRLGEQIAAENIYNRLQGFLPLQQDIPDAGIFSLQKNQENTSVSVHEDWFSERFSSDRASIWKEQEVVELWSSNIIMRFDTPHTDKKIVIGANYDNNFDGVYDGALGSGSSVAILLSLAQTCIGKELPFDIDIVFFGAGYFKGTPYHMGSNNYIDNLQGNILMMMNLARVGGETTYIYSDEVNTLLEDYFIDLGNLQKSPASLPQLSEAGGPDNIPYSRYGMIGNHSRFMQEGVASVNFFSGKYDGFFLSDKEGNKNILQKDNLENMIAAYPNAYIKMAQVANIVFTAATNPSFEDIVVRSNKEKFNYSFFLQDWIAYLILGTIIIIGYILLRFISTNLLKKYPLQHIVQKPSSVFGDEFEDNKSIFRH